MWNKNNTTQNFALKWANRETLNRKNSRKMKQFSNWREKQNVQHDDKLNRSEHENKTAYVLSSVLPSHIFDPNRKVKTWVKNFHSFHSRSAVWILFIFRFCSLILNCYTSSRRNKYILLENNTYTNLLQWNKVFKWKLDGVRMSEWMLQN